MPALPRKTQLPFAGTLAPTPSGNLAVWGSLAAGSPTYSNDLVAIQALAAWGTGLVGEVIGNRSPSLEDLQSLFFLITTQLQYILQAGIPDWDPTGNSQYFQNQVARVGKVTYQVTAVGPVGTTSPATDTNNWTPFVNQLFGPTIPKAWAVWDGIQQTAGNSRLISVFNVSTIQKVQAGQYLVNFTNAFPSANYTMTGSCGTENGQNYGPGDFGLVCGGPPNLAGSPAIRSTTQNEVFAINPSTLALVGPGCISAVWFGQ